MYKFSEEYYNIHFTLFYARGNINRFNNYVITLNRVNRQKSEEKNDSHNDVE